MNDVIDTAITRSGETLASLDDAPYFPATLDQPWNYATWMSEKTGAEHGYHAAVPRFRREVAEWIAV